MAHTHDQPMTVENMLKQDFWEALYQRDEHRIWSGNVNANLSSEVDGLKPGHALDLGATKAVSHVKLSWEAAYGKAYSIQTSADGTTWTTIYSTTTGNGATDDLTGLAGSGRYVRMNGVTRGTSYGYSLYEMQVYGPA